MIRDSQSTTSPPVTPAYLNYRRGQRLRWVTLGALAVALLSGIGVAQAAGGGVATSFVPVDPCRLFDYRPAPDTVGGRVDPLGPGETASQQVTGQVGNCDIPAGAAAVALNVTVVGATAASYLTIYPADAPAPLASSLNWVAGQPPTPNKVDVKLSGGGAIKLSNLAGHVNVLADVVGYYIPGGGGGGAELAQLRTEVDELWAAAPIAVGASYDEVNHVDSAGEIVRSVTIDAPAPGTVVVTSSHTMYETAVGHGLTCSITTGAQVVSTHTQVAQATTGASYVPMSGVRTFEILGDQPVTYNLVCLHHGGDLQQTSAVIDASIAAVYTPGRN